MPAITFMVVSGVQNICKCHCKAPFIKEVKSQKHHLEMFQKIVISEKQKKSLKNMPIFSESCRLQK